MNKLEEATVKRTAQLIRAARKQLGFTQIDLSKRLDISQGALSKLESAILIPSAPMWFTFCELTDLPVESFKTGFIDRIEGCTPRSGRYENGFKLPKRYANDRGTKVRMLLPWLNYFSSTMGERKLVSYLENQKLDPDFFVNLDSQINFNFTMDIARELTQCGHLKKSDFPTLVEPVKRPEFHGALHSYYDKMRTVSNLIRSFTSHMKKYSCNVNCEIEAETPKYIDFSVRPAEHLKQFNYMDDPVLKNFLCLYQANFAATFSTYGDRSIAPIKELECHYKGAPKCTYRMGIRQ